MEQTCEHCEYEWTTRVEKPKSCPRCKRRFDYYDTMLDLKGLE